MFKRILIDVLKCFLALSCLLTGGISQAVPDKNDVSKAKRTDRLHQHLTHLSNNSRTRNELVTIILETDWLDDASSQLLKSFDAERRYSFGRNHEIRIPADKFLSMIDRLPQSIHARLPYPHEAVAVTSQGVGLTGAEDMQALGMTAAGVKLGIIDLGFASYTTAQTSGDLPASLNIIDYTGTGTGGTNHGTQVAEIVHDMAPGAELYLAKVGTETQLQQAVNDMATAGVKVINHSVAWFGAGFYDGTGDLCDITNSAEAYGIQWVNAMGNSRNKHYLATFADSDSNLEHEFDSGQNYNSLNLKSGTPVTLVLNWDDYPVSRVDYNLYLYDGIPGAGGSLVASSQNKQSGFGGTPYEALVYTPVMTATHYIVVKKTSSSTSHIRFTLFSLGPNLTIRTTASSVVQPADCDSVISVGAVNLTDNAESFSSEGPTTDGRNKPEVSAPDGVTTSLSSSFLGTSAASPHVVGAAGLLLSQDPLLTTTQIRNILINDSYDVSPPGFDYRKGYGRISLDADLDTLNHDIDNCLLIANLDQLDLDSDGLGDACDDDIDGDGLSNADESILGTDPFDSDTDGDGLTDGVEVDLYLTDPLLSDTDNDGLSDGDEVLTYDTDPNVSNTGDLAPRNMSDGVLNAADFLILVRLIGQLETATDYEQTAADINSDGVLDVRDILLLRHTLNLL